MAALLLEEFAQKFSGAFSDWQARAMPAYDQNGQPTYLDDEGELIEGIYLDMPNEVYHSLPALSSSKLKKFMESPAHYYREYVSGIDRKRTVVTQRTFDTGSHAHMLILEPEGYYNLFFRAPIPSDYPDALHTAIDIEARLAELGLKKSGTKAEKIARLNEANPAIQIYKVIRQEYCLKHGPEGQGTFDGAPVTRYGGKIAIDAQIWDDAHRAEKTTREHAEADNYFQNGLPEVAMFARCPITGLMLKVKYDWLRFDDEAVDMKTTFSTKPEDFKRQLFNLHYDVQMEFYKYVAKLQDINIRSFIFVATEFVNADICQPYELPLKQILRASKNVQNNLKLIKECMETGNWFGWSEVDCTMMLE
jgi:hypothetical protein